MKKRNTLLIIGSIILLLLLVVILFPQFLTSKSPYTLEGYRFEYDDGKLSIESPPFPPSSEFLLGSDDRGRDIFSFIIYGTRLTLLLGVLVALGRFLFAIPMALLAGFKNELSNTIIKQLNIIFSAIPALLICIIILRINFFSTMDKTSSIIAFTIILSFVGWPKLGSLILERVEGINNLAFIKSEIAMGKKKRRIALENVIPHLAPELIVLFFMEIARALSMIMQLGLFSVFVGNLRIVNDTQSGSFFNVSFEPEWASMLATSRSLINSAPWAIIFPAIAFFISVLGFNLFGEGLRQAMQKKGSKVIPILRKAISLDFNGLNNSFNKKAKIKILSFFLIAILFISSPILISNQNYVFDNNKIDSILYDQVIIGTKEAQDTANQIVNSMIDLGIESMAEEGYIMEYEIPKSSVIVEESLSISIDNIEIDLLLDKDYTYIRAGNLDYNALLVDATRDDLFNISDYSKYSNKFVLIDKQFYLDSALNYFMDELYINANIKGFILIGDKDEDISNFIVKEDEELFSILVSKELGEKLRNSNVEVSVKTSINPIGTTGRNIIGIYKCDNYENIEDAILIALNYNYIEEEGKDILSFNLELMEKLCNEYENKRSIIFMFLDGTISETYNGIYDITEDFPYESPEIEVCIDLSDIRKKDFDVVEFSRAQAPITRYLAWSMGYQFEKDFKSNKIDVEEVVSIYRSSESYFVNDASDNTMFWKRGIANILVKTSDTGNKEHNILELGSIILEIINKNNY